MTEFQQFVVIRHGESQTNATNTFQAGNQYDSDPLTELGQQDARRLAERLAALPVDLVVSSSYLRARTTAGLIAEATQAPHVVPVSKNSSWVDLPVDDQEVRDRVSLLREIDVPSELQGLKFDDPRANEIQHAAMAVAHEPDGHYSDEENLHDLWHRAEEIRQNLEARSGRLIVVVAHGGILKVWLAHLMFTAIRGLDTSQQLSAYRGFTRLGWWDNTGVLSLRFSPDQGWLWLMTDIQHLEPDYFSFMPSTPRTAVAHPDTGAEYLGGDDAPAPS
ncbi:MAG TPA: histidine phosphatase family protein [Propionibacteriaceae bacterium]|nr:histidine phosphatase family protein [Propionibacteriaceae bacterium]